MAISPRSKGLGNIGSIVNRQRMAAPTRPIAKPVMAKPAPARPNTTTIAQRKAAPSPFRSATKPMARVNPMTGQPTQQPIMDMPMPIDQGFEKFPQVVPQPFNPFGGSPIQQAPVVDPNFGVTPGQIGGQPFNPQPNPYPGQGDFGLEPINMGTGYGYYQPIDDSGMIEGPPMGSSNVQWRQNASGGYDAYNPQLDFGGFLGNIFNTTSGPGNVNFGNMIDTTNAQYNGQPLNAAQNQLQNAFNPTSNTNPSNSGSLFGTGGFSTNG